MTDDAETTGSERPDRDPATGRFAAGNPGRPKGARHEALKALDAIGSDGAEAVLRSVVAAAQSGDMRAAEILLRRVWPERKGRPLALGLPELREPGDVVRALAAIVTATAAGERTADEAQGIAALVETQRRAIETENLAARIAALEAKR